MSDEERIAKLKSDIEALAYEVKISDTMLNEHGAPHEVIANGGFKAEGFSADPWPGLEEACRLSLKNAEVLRGPKRSRVLYWRAEPELGGKGSLYMRLSFA